MPRLCSSVLSCCRNDWFGLAAGLVALSLSSAASRGSRSFSITYARATEAERETPALLDIERYR